MFTQLETQLIELLGQNLTQTQAAKAVGVDEAEISKLLTSSEFALAVSERRIVTLTAATKRDNTADDLEDLFAKKLKESAPFATKPLEIARIYQIVNGAKRRGASADDQAKITNQTNIVVLQLPEVTKQKFTTNPRNEVVAVADRPMVTIDSNHLLQQVKLLPSPTTEKKGGKANDQLAITEI